MTSTDTTSSGSWPPPFDDCVVAEGRRLVEQHGGMLVVGPPGSGRLALARAMASPWPVRIHRGSLASVSTPYYALRRLAPHIEISDGHLPADLALELGQRRPDGVAPVTVVLIGADLCDSQSLQTLIERASQGSFALIGTIRPEALAHHRFLGTAASLELPALDHAGVASMLRRRFGREPDPVAVEFVHARSQGVHSAVVAVTESAVSLGLLAEVEDTLTLMPDPGDPAELPPVGLGAGSYHLHDLLDVSPELTDLLQIVALVDEVDVHELMAALPPGPLDLAVTHGVLKIVDDVVTFVLDAEAAAVDSSLTLPRRMELHDTYKEHFPRTFERPRAAMRAALCRRKMRRQVEPELAELGARQANLEGLYREALTITEPQGPDDPVAAPMERAFALVELGEIPELVQLLQDTDPAALTDEELTDFILLRWTHLPPRDDEDADILTGDDDSVRRRIAVLRLARVWATAFQRSSPELETEVRSLVFSGALSRLNTATGYLALSTLQRNGGRPVQAVESARTALDLLREVPAANAYVLEPAHEILATALLDTLDFPAAEQVLVDYSSRAAPHGRTARMGHALWGLLEYRRGRVGLALTHSRLCLQSLRATDPQGISGWVQSLTAELLAHQGLMAEAESLLASRTPTSPRLQHDLERRTTMAAALDAIGRPDEAIALLHGVVEEARDAGLGKAEIDAAAMLVQISGPHLLPVLSRAVAAMVDPSGVPKVWAQFAAAVETEDVTTLFVLVAQLADRGAAVLAAEIARFTLDFAEPGRALSPGQRILLEHVAYAGATTVGQFH